jgi:hypothetical protein
VGEQVIRERPAQVDDRLLGQPFELARRDPLRRELVEGRLGLRRLRFGADRRPPDAAANVGEDRLQLELGFASRGCVGRDVLPPAVGAKAEA